MLDVKQWTPPGKDPSDPGDFEKPQSVSIDIVEDRWGNHYFTIREHGRVVHRELVNYRITQPMGVVRRTAFAVTAAGALADALFRWLKTARYDEWKAEQKEGNDVPE